MNIFFSKKKLMTNLNPWDVCRYFDLLNFFNKKYFSPLKFSNSTYMDRTKPCDGTKFTSFTQMLAICRKIQTM